MVKKVIFLFIIGIFIAGCVKEKPVQNEISFSSIENKTNENPSVSILNCDSNLTYLDKEDCKCNNTWFTNRHAHSFCTPSKMTTYSCRKTQGNKIKGEVDVFFKAGTTLEEAEKIIVKNGGKILIYTCWFENRDDPYLTVFVGEDLEQSFITLVLNETIVSSAYENFFASVNV